jgi:hypothetical protein
LYRSEGVFLPFKLSTLADLLRASYTQVYKGPSQERLMPLYRPSCQSRFRRCGAISCCAMLWVKHVSLASDGVEQSLAALLTSENCVLQNQLTINSLLTTHSSSGYDALATRQVLAPCNHCCERYQSLVSGDCQNTSNSGCQHAPIGCTKVA